MLRRLLIAEGDPAQARALAEAFPAEDFLVRVEATGQGALVCASQWRPECLLLSANLPGLSGLEVCRRVKADRRGLRAPVLIVADNRDQTLVNRSLREGADDVMPKPCHPTELLWRVRGLLRRYEAPAPAAEVLKLGPLELDPEQGVATLSGKELGLTKKELQLLELFLRHPGRVLTRRFLLENVWGYDSAVRTRVVDLTVFQLRKKLGRGGERWLSTRRGFGYSLRGD